MTAEDKALDVLWRDAFGEPLPILCATEVVTQVFKAKRAADRARGHD